MTSGAPLAAQQTATRLKTCASLRTRSSATQLGTSLPSRLRALINKVKFVVPDDLPMPVYPITTGIFANAPHPNAAKLFIAFVLSKEQQHRLTAAGAISVRPDVEPPPGLEPLSNYRIADG